MDNIIYLSDYQELRKAAEEALDEQEAINHETELILGQLMLDVHDLCESYKECEHINEEDLWMVIIMALQQRRDGFSPV